MKNNKEISFIPEAGVGIVHGNTTFISTLSLWVQRLSAKSGSSKFYWPVMLKVDICFNFPQIIIVLHCKPALGASP